MLANAKRELGDYDESIEGYKSVLQGQPTESGVAIALMQAQIESAWDSIEKGLFGHAVRRAAETVYSLLILSKVDPMPSICGGQQGGRCMLCVQQMGTK